MGHSIKLDYTSQSANHIKVAREAIKKAGGTYTGDDQNGDFEIPTPLGKIAGHFIIEPTCIEIIITHKPFLITHHRIEKELRKFAGG